MRFPTEEAHRVCTGEEKRSLHPKRVPFRRVQRARSVPRVLGMTLRKVVGVLDGGRRSHESPNPAVGGMEKRTLHNVESGVQCQTFPKVVISG